MKLTIGELQNSKPTGSLWSPADFVLVLVSGGGGGRENWRGSEIRSGLCGKTAQGKIGTTLLSNVHLPGPRVTRIFCENLSWFKKLTPQCASYFQETTIGVLGLVLFDARSCQKQTVGLIQLVF